MEPVMKNDTITTAKPIEKLAVVVVVAGLAPKSIQHKPRHKPYRSNQPAILTPEQHEQVRHIFAKPMTYASDTIFTQPDAHRTLFDNAVHVPPADSSWYITALDRLESSDVRTDHRHTTLYLNPAQERTIFLQFNYARYRVITIQSEFNINADSNANDNTDTNNNTSPAGVTNINGITYDKACELIYWYDHSKHLADQITQHNLALVIAMAGRFRRTGISFPELVSEGNMALLRAINKFNGNTGYKFSTYACRAIVRSFYSLVLEQNKIT